MSVQNAFFGALMTLGLPVLITSTGVLAQPEAVVVFDREARDAYAAIRIPALVQSKNGTLLAFAEGRPVDHDHGKNDIILRRSEDSGRTWNNAHLEEALKTPPCMSSLVALEGEHAETLLFHTLPNTRAGRRNGQLYRSTDGGTTWIRDQLICPHGFAYSALTALQDGRLGCLYERDGYRTIRYAVLGVKR